MVPAAAAAGSQRVEHFATIASSFQLGLVAVVAAAVVHFEDDAPVRREELAKDRPLHWGRLAAVAAAAEAAPIERAPKEAPVALAPCVSFLLVPSFPFLAAPTRPSTVEEKPLVVAAAVAGLLLLLVGSVLALEAIEATTWMDPYYWLLEKLASSGLGEATRC